jgi:hypothetical protein
VLRLPPQCTFWRFLASLHLGIAQQLLEVQRRMRERVWEAAHVQLTTVNARWSPQIQRDGRKAEKGRAISRLNLELAPK